jgi:hypothetical protein
VVEQADAVLCVMVVRRFEMVGGRREGGGEGGGGGGGGGGERLIS